MRSMQNRWRWRPMEPQWCLTSIVEGCTASASTPTNTGACRHQRGPIRSADQETRKRWPSNVLGEECWVTSRGGRVQRRSLTDGQLLEEHLLNQRMLPSNITSNTVNTTCSAQPKERSRGCMTWNPIKQLRLSGPVQSAVYDEQAAGWRIAGWREEVVITRENEHDVLPTNCRFMVVPMGSGALVLYNDGSWENSPFEFSVSHEG